MSIYIEDKEGNVYKPSKLTHKKKLEFQKEFLNEVDGENGADKIAKVEKIAYEILHCSYPEMTEEKYEEIIEYNDENIGYENVILILSEFVEQAFQSTGTNPNKYPFLEELRKKQEEKKLQN